MITGKHPEEIIIGSRGSKLALWQAQYTRDRLEAAGFKVGIRIIKTKGDRIQHLSFDKIEGKGFFTREIEDALQAGEIDLAVHSCKDMPTESPEGLSISAYSSRASARDVLLIPGSKADPAAFLELPDKAVVGTSSARRKAQLLALRPDIRIKDIRGNVPTRIGKLKDGKFDAILLAAAGLDRLGPELTGQLEDLKRLDLPETMFIPAPAQGILAYQVRSGDPKMKPVLDALNDAGGAAAAQAERDILAAFHGGCQVPIGIHARTDGTKWQTWISRSEAWNSVPRRMFVETVQRPDAGRVVRMFDSAVSGSVFISTDLAEDDYFRRHMEAMGAAVHDEPLIEFRHVDFHTNLDVDWLFFSSKNAARYFFERFPELPENVRVAAINKGTGGALAALGHPADYTGEGGSMQQIAEGFDATDGDRVLFPRAKHSRRTVQKLLARKAVSDVVVYDNYARLDVDRRVEDVLVFTSPMNVESYTDKHPIAETQKVAAIGNSTADALRKAGYSCAVAYEPTRWGLVDVVTRLLLEDL